MKCISLVSALALLAGCSTIVEGTKQDISVNTTPPGAECVFQRQGQTLGTIKPTPGTLIVEKTKHDIMITCSKPGYDTRTYVNKSDVAGATVGNIILGGGIGWAIDSSTGSDNKYTSPVDITLNKK